MDVRNAMSLAIVLPALLDELGLEFDSRLFFNTDVTTLFLKDLLESGRITKKSKKWLKKNRLGASRTQENSFVCRRPIDVHHRDYQGFADREPRKKHCKLV